MIVCSIGNPTWAPITFDCSQRRYLGSLRLGTQRCEVAEMSQRGSPVKLSLVGLKLGEIKSVSGADGFLEEQEEN